MKQEKNGGIPNYKGEFWKEIWYWKLGIPNVYDK